MKLQKNIIIVFTIYAFIVTIVFSAIYYRMQVHQYTENEYYTYKAVANAKMQQFEDMIETMEAGIVYFLSDITILEALQDLANMPVDTFEEIYFDVASAKVRSKLSSYYILDQFYKVVVFNENGVVITNKTQRISEDNPTYAMYPWKKEIIGKKGQDILLGLREDYWSDDKEKLKVLSVVKEIQGMNMGWIEVQQSTKELEKLLFRDMETYENVSFLFMTKSGDFLCASNDNLDYKKYQNLLKEKDGILIPSRNELNQETIYIKTQSAMKDVVMFTIIDSDITKNAMLSILPLSIILLISMILLSIVYIGLTSRRLTKPIRELRNLMNHTELEYIENQVPAQISDDEIGMLYGAYQDVLIRLQHAIVKEKQLSVLQLKAQFDLLQAQVNPHFIYNVLNVISNRGMLSEDEEICDMCSKLAQMLRYSTNTKQKLATVEEETHYLELYLSLLKYRYDYKLQYKIQIDEEVKHIQLPKIVLQQFVENSIKHGYNEKVGIIDISVIGKCFNEQYEIRIRDNGQGIPQNRLSEIETKIDEIKDKLMGSRENVEMGIGGMGLLNSYARLLLQYGQRLNFLIISKDEGTEVIIRLKGGEESNV